MSLRSIRVINWGVVGIWLFLLGILVYRHYISGVELSPVRAMTGDAFRVSDQWFGIYRGGEKMGYMHLTAEKIGDEYRFVQYVTTRVSQQGKEMSVTNRLRCLSDSDYRLKSFDFENESVDSVFKAHGEYKDGLLVMLMEQDGEHRGVNREMREAPYFPLTVKSALFEQGLAAGKKFRLPVLDLLTLQVLEATADVEQLVPIKAGNDVFTAYRIGITYGQGSKSEMWISESGVPLKEDLGAGMSAFYEPELLAKEQRGRDQYFDYLAVPTVESNQIISEPSKVKSMKVRLSGVELGDFPALDGDYQMLNENILTIRRVDEMEFERESYELPYQQGDLSRYLQPTRWIQSSEPKIIDFAKAVTGSVPDVGIVAGTIVGRMYAWIKREPVPRIPTPLDAQESRVGECLENTVLYTAMARSRGMPARMAAGLVPIRGVFYFHTWPEVWIGRWVPADPTRGEWPASAARIRFVIGDMEELVSFTKVIGKIQIEVLGVS
jgi:hypothetical protein